ncbi:MAG: acyl-CoA dehydrogenase [Acidobacteria bacterium]|nr:acyl-CoA dehydrogenase [Acidobacteriota bacterium]
MSTYRIDEEDLLFQIRECPGLASLTGVHPSPDCQADTAEMILDQISGFAKKVLAPLRQDADQFGCQFDAGKVKVAPGLQEAWDAYRELGVMAMCEGAEFGGAELPHFFQVPVTECECGSFVSFSMLPLLTKEAANLIASFGSDDLKKTYVPNMYNGTWSGTMCLTEPQAGSDVGSAVTKAVPEGDHYLISGTKIFITWGEHDLSENIIHLVLARVPGAPEGTKGLSLFVVPKVHPDGTPNDVVCGSIEHKMGIHASPTAVLNFGNDGKCIGYLVGQVNQGMSYMFQMMNRARINVGVQGMAQASAAYLDALQYARERKQGVVKTAEGLRSVPIIEHPDIQNMLLKMRAVVHGARNLFSHLGLFQDLAEHGENRAFNEGLVELLTPISKTYGSDYGFRVAEWAVQVFGGYGYCRDYGMEQYLRDLKITSIYEGTNGIQALDLVFRKLLGSKGALLQNWFQYLAPVLADCQGTDFSKLAEGIQKAHQALGEVCKRMGLAMANGKVQSVQFHASAFQEAMCHVVIAGLHLKQALVARQLVESGQGSLSENFYRQKEVSCRFYFSYFLPSAVVQLQKMDFEDAGIKELSF